MNMLMTLRQSRESITINRYVINVPSVGWYECFVEVILTPPQVSRRKAAILET